MAKNYPELSEETHKQVAAFLQTLDDLVMRPGGLIFLVGVWKVRFADLGVHRLSIEEHDRVLH